MIRLREQVHQGEAIDGIAGQGRQVSGQRRGVAGDDGETRRGEAIQMRHDFFAEPGAGRVGENEIRRSFEIRDVVLDARMFHAQSARGS